MNRSSYKWDRMVLNGIAVISPLMRSLVNDTKRNVITWYGRATYFFFWKSVNI